MSKGITMFYQSVLGRSLNSIEALKLAGHRSSVNNLQDTAGVRNIGNQECVPNPGSQIASPLDTIRPQGNGIENQIYIVVAVLNAGQTGRGQSLFERLHQGAGLSALMILGKFPNHYPAKTMVAGITNLGLAGPLIIVGNEHVIYRVCVGDAKVGRLSTGIPMVEIRLIITGHDVAIRDGGGGGRIRP